MRAAALFLRNSWRRWPGQTIYQAVAETPERLERRVLYAVGEDTPWSAVLLCPCGCEDAVFLSLVEGDRPHWCLALDPNDRPTLSPSVHRKVGCQSHFHLRRGSIVWAGRQSPRKTMGMHPFLFQSS